MHRLHRCIQVHLSYMPLCSTNTIWEAALKGNMHGMPCTQCTQCTLNAVEVDRRWAASRARTPESTVNETCHNGRAEHHFSYMNGRSISTTPHQFTINSWWFIPNTDERFMNMDPTLRTLQQPLGGVRPSVDLQSSNQSRPVLQGYLLSSVF